MNIGDGAYKGNTLEKVQKWAEAKRRLHAARLHLETCVNEAQVAEDELGAWLVPEKFQDPVHSKEWFNIWFGSGVLKASACVGSSHYVVAWLKEPDAADKEKYRL